MTTEAIVSIVVLAVIMVGIVWILRTGRKEAEMIFESDYYHLREFIKDCHITEENELKIRCRLLHLSKMPGADVEKLQVLNSGFRRKFTVSLGDIVADHESE